MMHPWDREHSATDKPGINWLSILMAILLGIFGFAMAAKLSHVGKGPLVVPVVFAGLGSMYFLMRGFKGGGCCSAPRTSWREDGQIATGQPVTPREAGVVTPPATTTQPKKRRATTWPCAACLTGLICWPSSAPSARASRPPSKPAFSVSRAITWMSITR